MVSEYRLLKDIDSPSDLKKIPREKLAEVCSELRQFIIDVISSNPGHFASSLGVTELTVALHYVMNTPYDQIVWDVGHQAYGHKILTGRIDVFHTNRKYKGISGFPKMEESPYDSFGTGHSSTSISAALGLAKAARLKGEHDRQVIAVIGDGSLTGGLAFEGLNNAGIEKSNLLVILNDNNMAIDPNVGAMKEYLTDITTSKLYNKVKTDVWNLLGYLSKIGPNAQKYVQKIENGIKSIILRQSNMFESMNFRYFGPVDGHDILHLVQVLNDLKDIPGPKLLHVLTKKGKGFRQAELNQTAFHAPGKFDRITGEFLKVTSSKSQPPRFQDVFGHTIVELAETNKKIIGITPAMPTGSSLNIMMEKMPHRAFDVGIAEQHAVTFSAGLAAAGMIPFCNIYSSFMQRAYDQVIHDVVLQKLPVVFCLDRAGLVGDDGATHHGAYDLAYMRLIPDIIISAPMDEIDMRDLMYTAQIGKHGPFVIRYPRGRGIIENWKVPFHELEIGKGRKIRSGNDIAILTLGKPGTFAVEAAEILESEGIHLDHYDMRFLKPLDEDILHTVFKKHKIVLTVEDGTIVGGFGSAVLEFMSDNGYHAKIVRLGIPDRFIEHGTQEELYQECGYDTDAIVARVKYLAGKKVLSNAG